MNDRYRAGLRLAIVGVATVLAMSACTGDSGDSGGGWGPVDAPLAFEADPLFTMTDDAQRDGWPAVTLHEEKAFRLDWRGLTVYDVTSGDELARFEPERPVLFDPAESGDDAFLFPPALVEVDGEPVVLAGFAVEKSTGAVQLDVEIIAVDAVTGAERWRFAAPNPAPVARRPQRSASVVVQGAHDGVAVVEVTRDSAASVAFGLTLDDPEVVWTTDEQTISAVDDGVAVGVAHDGPLTALDVATGDQIWTGADPEKFSIGPAGPWLIVTENYDTPESTTELIRIADNEVVRPDGLALTGGMFCLDDEQAAVVVCIEDDTAAVALDTETGEVLWHDDSWTGQFKGLYHRAVYVERDDAAVVVDARSGEVIGDDAGVAPAVANDHAGVDQDGTTVNVYAAQG